MIIAIKIRLDLAFSRYYKKKIANKNNKYSQKQLIRNKDLNLLMYIQQKVE